MFFNNKLNLKKQCSSTLARAPHEAWHFSEPTAQKKNYEGKGGLAKTSFSNEHCRLASQTALHFNLCPSPKVLPFASLLLFPKNDKHFRGPHEASARDFLFFNNKLNLKKQCSSTLTRAPHEVWRFSEPTAQKKNYESGSGLAKITFLYSLSLKTRLTYIVSFDKIKRQK